ncbi:MAG: VOC family protein [Methyloversatilis sp.]|nr:VOC family protein [Methyloversatilis sp.]
MPQQIYINLPVKDLARARAFYSALGFTLNPQFSNDDAICMVVSDTIYLMLLTEPFFAGFTGKPIADATRTTEVLLCLSRDSRAAVDELVAKALAAGGAVPRPPQDYGFMYGHGFEDPDGHIWELSYMDMSAAPPH